MSVAHWMQYLPIEIYVAWRYMRFNLKQSFIVALAVGIGVSIIIFIPSINLSFFGYFLEKTVESNAHIKVVRELDTEARNRQTLKTLYPDEGRILVSDQSLTRRRDIKAYKNLVSEIMRIDGITTAAPYVSESVIIVRGSQTRTSTMRGILPEAEKNISNIEENIQQGSLDTLSDDQVILGWRLADELGVNVGNRIQLLTNFGKKSLKVSALSNTGIYQQDLSTILVTLDTAQALLNMPNEVTGIGLKVRDMYQAENLARLIARTFDLKTTSWMEDNAVFLDQIRMFRVIIAFISFLIVFAAASSITSILIMVVASKSKDIGILKAMGTPPNAIMRMFLLQAIILSLIGVVAGIGGATFLIELYNATPYSKAETFLGIGRQPVTLNLEYTVYAIFYATLSSILASLIPAWQAGKLDPVEAINQ
ncbi:MAG: ABC transporter permease [Vampirovibrio sp.]|nr:ABC transporter permease [Vampirovibrio sp.]